MLVDEARAVGKEAVALIEPPRTRVALGDLKLSRRPRRQDGVEQRLADARPVV